MYCILLHSGNALALSSFNKNTLLYLLHSILAASQAMSFFTFTNKKCLVKERGNECQGVVREKLGVLT